FARRRSKVCRRRGRRPILPWCARDRPSPPSRRRASRWCHRSNGRTSSLDMRPRALNSLPAVFRRLEDLLLAGSGADDFEDGFKLLVASLWAERWGTSRFAGRTAQLLLDQAGRAWPELFEDHAPRFRLEASHLDVCAQALADVRVTADSGQALDALFEFLTA